MAMRKTWFWLGGLIAASAVLLDAQEQPLSIGGAFTTGYYASSARGEQYENLKFVPFGAKFDMNGFFINPDLLSFTAQPELNVGPQASEAGFEGGNGIRLRTNLLRKLFPLTFRYSNVQVEDVFFGSLSQISGYTLQERMKDLGLTLALKPAKPVETTIDWGINSVDSQPGIAEIPDYLSHGRHVNFDTRYAQGGWLTEAFFHDQVEDSNLLQPIAGGTTTTGTLQQKAVQYQGSVKRGFLGDSELYLNGGGQSTSSLLYTLPIDMTNRYASANVRLFQKRRWRAALRAAYSSNLAGQLLAQAAGSLVGAGSVAQSTHILVPFSNDMSNYNLQGITNIDVAKGLGLYFSAERGAVFSSNTVGPLNANYLTTEAGLTHAKRLKWGSVSSQYARQFGLGSVTGQAGTIQGQVYRASLLEGNPSGLRFEGTLQGNDQSVHNAQPLSSHGVSVDCSVADRVYHDFNARLGGGWQWGSVTNNANDFRSSGYVARAGIEHPRFQVNGSLNSTLSNSLPIYGQALSNLGVAEILATSLPVIPSDYRGINLTLHAIPLRKVEFSAMWTHSREHLAGIVNNDFQFLDSNVTYHFRRIQLQAGFIRSNQIFLSYPDTIRTRFYIRIVRAVKLL
jgi:hypothetical protein